MRKIWEWRSEALSSTGKLGGQGADFSHLCGAHTIDVGSIFGSTTAPRSSRPATLERRPPQSPASASACISLRLLAPDDQRYAQCGGAGRLPKVRRLVVHDEFVAHEIERVRLQAVVYNTIQVKNTEAITA